MLTDHDRQILRSERTFRPSSDEHDEFFTRMNERANFFRMKTTGCASVDDKRLRNWNNPPKEVNLKRTGIGFYGGAYRRIEYEHIGAYVRINCVFLEEIENVPIGTTMARVDGNRLVITKFNGSKPSELVDTFIIKEEEPKPTKITKICARCNREAGEGPYCSQKCRRKHEKKLFGEMKRSPSRDKTSLPGKQDLGLKYVLMVKSTIDAESRS